ncbi:hypothetical protein BDN70DRAFT_844484 [Pholiota conissans]|uniref:F-box domain-containing protein n=1 Tax=Pholiota conissans TaxID=109636 RepID=A0A9P6CMM1_9AGAR|nr:hypothetical protein BDN70DRAFT_844484 [Pholiota conissans]
MLLDLPTELVVQIFFNLPPLDLLSCQLSCKYLHNVVRDSILLQYHMALIAAKASDNPCSTLPVSTKLAQLKEGDMAWAVLKPTSSVKIPVEHNPSGIYDLTGGVYLLGNSNRKDLHYIRLPSHADEKTEWNEIKVGRTIIDMGLCVYEHDLIAVVTTTPSSLTPNTFDIELVLFEFSTGKPHPQAQKHYIHVTNTRWEKPAIGIEIVGDNLVLILFYHRHEARPEDKVFVYNWRTAATKTCFSVPYNTYTGLIFLDEYTILLPNTQTSALDIFRIPSTPNLDSTAHIPLVSLSLPRLADGRTVGGISCRAEPNPIGAASYLDKKKEARERANISEEEEDMFPKRGYLASAEQAICIFALRVLGGQPGNPFGHTFTFVVHRNTINDVVHEFERKREGKAEADAYTTRPAIDAHAKKSLDAPEEGTPIPEAPSSPPRISWKDWGPSITRWFNSDSIPTRWITTTAGQRCVLIADSAPDTGFPYVVLDFNERNVFRMKRWQKARNLREKQRERRSRTLDREREIEETMEWAETSQSETQTTEESEAETGDDDDEESWYDIDPEDEDEDQEPVVHHSGMAMVEDEDLNETGTPGVIVESEDLGNGTESASASGVSVTPEASEEDSDIVLLADEAAVEAQVTQSEDHATQGDQSNADITMETEAEDANTSAPGPAPHSAPTRRVPLRSRGDPTINIERDPDNPLEGSDTTASRRIWCVTTSELVEPAETFAERVEGSLPYVACASGKTYPFNGVLLDEERILGIRVDFLDRIRQIEVHHFG